jgi:carbonic anhydrase
MGFPEDLLENNRRYAAGFELGDLPRQPARKIAIVTCMDARLDVHALLGIGEGDAHVLRNAGGHVTDDVVRSLEVSRSLGTEHVALILHTDCAGQDGDLSEAVRASLPRLGDGARGFVYDVATGRLREVQ